VEVRRKATEYLGKLVSENPTIKMCPFSLTFPLSKTELALSVGPFAIDSNDGFRSSDNASNFALEAPTTLTNTLRLLRAMQLKKPILLEGSPGVGKTALVTAIAKMSGHSLARINLSEQTDISDLFGADLPVEGKDGGHFEWRDGPLLQALKSNSWILLDELNLASQSVLEGLNACLDHRGSVFIPELNKTFKIFESEETSNFSRIFGCQNPVRQGGARKGLPKSFLNRFTQVFIEALTVEDFSFVLQTTFPMLPKSLVDLMSKFSSTIQEEICQKGTFGAKGSPWDINLRDLMRWAHLTVNANRDEISTKSEFEPELYVDLIYGLRMRCSKDRANVLQLFCEMYGEVFHLRMHPNRLLWGQNNALILEDRVVCGNGLIERIDRVSGMTDNQLLVLQKDLPYIEALISCLKTGWMPILVNIFVSSSFPDSLMSCDGTVLLFSVCFHVVELHPEEC
jgi:midasin